MAFRCMRGMNLFLNYVMECGLFLRTDNCSLEMERFDYARVLVSTPSLDIISLVEKLLIDGVLMEVKIVEE